MFFALVLVHRLEPRSHRGESSLFTQTFSFRGCAACAAKRFYTNNGQDKVEKTDPNGRFARCKNVQPNAKKCAMLFITFALSEHCRSKTYPLEVCQMSLPFVLVGLVRAQKVFRMSPPCVLVG